MKIVKTYYCRIYCGLKEGYDGIEHPISEVYDFFREYCDRVGFGINIQETKFIYTGGEETGAIIEIINYPRFPRENRRLKEIAYIIAYSLMEKFNQYRMSILFPDITVMIEKDDESNMRI